MCWFRPGGFKLSKGRTSGGFFGASRFTFYVSSQHYRLGQKISISPRFFASMAKLCSKQPLWLVNGLVPAHRIGGKQGSISVSDTEQMTRTLALKSYEGGFKIMIIWMAEKMNSESSNKILKLLEESPAKTVFLLLTEEEDKILKTIYSRCQLLSLPLLSQNDLAQALTQHHGLTQHQAQSIAKTAHGDYYKAQQLIDAQGEEPLFEQWFLQWARGAFKAKGNKKAIQELLSWSDHMAGLGRETQKSFLTYCSGLIRQAFLTHYKTRSLVYYNEYHEDFDLAKLAPFIHQNNIWQIQGALQEAEEHIERNGNAKIIFTDLAVQLTRLLHQSAD